MKRILLFLPALMLPLVGPAPAQEESPEPKRLSAEVLWQLDRLGAPVISPHGEHVVVPATSYEVESDESETRLWLLPSDDVSDEAPDQRAISAAGVDASSPVFSPDGSTLAFVSKRDEDDAGQVYLLPMDAPGEAMRLTEVTTGVSALKWVGEHIYFISSVWPDKTFDEMAEALEREEESKVSAHVWTEMPYAYFDTWLDEDREDHLFRIPADGGEIEPLSQPAGLQLSPANAGTGDYDVSPDEQRLAIVADSAVDSVYPNPDVYLVEVGGDDRENLSGENLTPESLTPENLTPENLTPENLTPDNLTRGNAAPDTAPMFSPDGRLLAFSRQHIPGFYGDQRKLMLHELATGRTRLVHGDWDRSADGLVWSPDSAGLFGAIDDAGTRRVFFLPLSGAEPVAVTEATNYDALAVAEDGTLVARNQSFVYPPRIVRVDVEGGEDRRLESFNDEVLEEVDMGTYESVTYTGADGAEIQMWVHYPPGFDPDREYPLFLLIHGGPHGAVSDMFHFRWNAQTFSSWGYVTAWHNFHGSSGFGQDFTDAINPDWMSKPYADTIAAAEWFTEKPWIDTGRMVAGGGSYGGYLSTVLLGRDHPFNALVIHAAVYDLYAQTSADFAVHDQRFGPYWESPEIYRTISPHYFADEFDTPSLIIHGQKDLRVPVGQAFELFRTLQTRGVESRLVYYPDENHWVLKPNNSLHWYGEVRDWLERFAEPGPEDAAEAKAETATQAEPEPETKSENSSDEGEKAPRTANTKISRGDAKPQRKPFER